MVLRMSKCKVLKVLTDSYYGKFGDYGARGGLVYVVGGQRGGRYAHILAEVRQMEQDLRDLETIKECVSIPANYDQLERRIRYLRNYISWARKMIDG